MKKIEIIWQFLLLQALTKGIFRHTQQDLARRFSISLSTVSHAIQKPTAIGAIRKESKFFVLEDVMKLLYFWASARNLQRRIIYQTHVDMSVTEIEGIALPTSLFACYSAARLILGTAPADYASVYFYDDPIHLDAIKTRFPPVSGKPPNVIFLEKSHIMDADGVTTLPLTFVDIWNLPDWYAKDFIAALEVKIHGLLSRSHHT